MDCIFCKIIKGQIKAKIVLETTKSIAFLGAFPLTTGHTLVVPKNHHEKIQHLSDDENRDLFDVVHKLLPKIDSLTGASLVAAHNGKDAGQEIPHVHIHIIPRSHEDSAGAVHSMFKNRPNLSDSEFEEVLSRLKS